MREASFLTNAGAKKQQEKLGKLVHKFSKEYEKKEAVATIKTLNKPKPQQATSKECFKKEQSAAVN